MLSEMLDLSGPSLVLADSFLALPWEGELDGPELSPPGSRIRGDVGQLSIVSCS